MELINLSNFSVQPVIVMNNQGKETLLVVVKGTYVLDGVRAYLNADQEKILMADEYNGEPGLSSIRYAGETTLFKPATDLIILGSALPRRRDEQSVDVVLQAGKIRKTVRVFGDRYWVGKKGSERISEPQPFDCMPLVFERAFGGIDDSPDPPEADPRNPIGKGFRAKNSQRPTAGTLLPNLENPAQMIRTPSDRPAPAGTGFVAPHWEPRRTRAGTYDEKWQNERAPFLPDDFDPLFHQSAPLDQVYPGYMEGGEPITVVNVSPSGRLSFLLPSPKFDVAVRIGEDRHSLQMRLDTVVIDADNSRLRMVWRGSLSIHNQIYDVEWIKAAMAEEA
ncbi:MAG: DUF2169 domain-containing protein [Nitrospirae bacterium]|nr:DUF2169 domain-containing protein [Nitrospirota bacterium]